MDVAYAQRNEEYNRKCLHFLMDLYLCILFPLWCTQIQAHPLAKSGLTQTVAYSVIISFPVFFREMFMFPREKTLLVKGDKIMYRGVSLFTFEKKLFRGANKWS